MKPAAFTYHRPSTLAEALAALAATPGAKVLAGGQSLVPLLSMRLAAPVALVDINEIPELGHVAVDEAGVTFGATVRHARLLADAAVAAAQPLVRAALRHVAHATIRNRGTTVGSIVHADPSGEMPAVFALLGGRLSLASVRGTREVGADELFVGPLETSLAPDEIATQAWLPALPSGHGVAFEEVARRHGDYALCGVGAVVGHDADGALVTARAAYLSVCDTPTVVDLTATLAGGDAILPGPGDTALPGAGDSALSGTHRTGFTDAALAAAGEEALAHLEPQTDIHATAHYRAQLVRVLTTRALRAAHDDAVRRRTSTPEADRA